MDITCRCGCGKPANSGAEYYGVDAAERGRHRARRQSLERAQGRHQEQTRQQQRALLESQGMGSLSLPSLAEATHEHVGLTAALVAEALDRADACDEAGYQVRLLADTAVLVARVATLEIEARSAATEATRMAVALDRAEARAAQADADAASRQRSRKANRPDS